MRYQDWFQQFIPDDTMGGYQWPSYWNSYAAPSDYSPLFYTMHPDIEPFQAWSRQMISTLYQNWYNSEGQKMARMKEAGINPYLAAQGVAGSGGSSGSVASAPPQGNAAASMDALANVPSAVADVVSKGVASYDTLKTLSHRLPNIDANTRKAFIDAGFTQAETDGILIDNKYKEQDWLAELNIKRQEFSNMQRDYELVEGQRDFIKKQIDWYDKKMNADISLEEMQRLQLDKQKMFIEAQMTMQNLENEWTAKYWSKMSDPVNVALKNLFIRSLDSDSPLESFERGYQELMKFYASKAEIDADASAAATWLTRPSNAFESTAYIGSQLGKIAPNLFKFIISKNQQDVITLDKIRANKDAADEFNDAYDDAKSELYNNYRAARREYRSVKYSSAADTYKYEAKQRMLAAKREYDEFTEDVFSKLLIKQVSGSDSIK